MMILLLLLLPLLLTTIAIIIIISIIIVIIMRLFPGPFSMCHFCFLQAKNTRPFGTNTTY